MAKAARSNVSVEKRDYQKRSYGATNDPTSEQRSKADLGIGERPACFSSTFQEVLFVIVITMVITMGSYPSGAVTVMSTFIAKDIHLCNAEIIWLTASSSLTGGAFLLVFGRLADLTGRRMIVIVSMFCFAMIGLGAGFSQNGITIDILLGMLGLCSAAAVPAGLGILGSVYDKPSKRKNYAFACMSAGNPIGFIFGTIFTGIAVQIFNWRAGLWLIAIIFSAFTVIAFFTLPADTTEKMKLSGETLKRFDLVGALLIVSGVALFSAGLSLGPATVDGWTESYVLVCLILGFCLIVIFVFWELYYPEPLVDFSFWKNRNFTLVLASISATFTGFTVSSFWVSLYFQRVWKFDPIEVAVHLLPMAIMGILVNVFAGLVLHRVSNRWLMAAASLSYVIAYLILAVQKYGYTFWVFIFLPQLCLVIGADLQFNVANMYIMSAFVAGNQSLAGSILQMMLRLMSTIGFAAASAIYDSVQRNPPRTGYYAGNPVAPYAAVWWFAFGLSFITVACTPFLTIKTQGHRAREEDEEDDDDDDEGVGQGVGPGVVATGTVAGPAATETAPVEADLVDEKDLAP